MTTDCLFCKIARGEIPSKKVYEDDQIVAFEDINPRAPVHILIIPRMHFANVDSATEFEKDILGTMILKAGEIARSKGVAASGYRLILNTNADAGQEVYHIHLHLLAGRKFTWPPG